MTRLPALAACAMAAIALTVPGSATAAGSDPPPANGAAFHMRFPSPLRWARVLEGEVSSDGPATCEARVGLRVGRDGNRMLARRVVHLGRCDRTWRPLRITFTTAQRRRVVAAARREHRRPVLFIQVRGKADGSSRTDAHAGAFPVELRGVGPRRDSPPGTTRIAAGGTVFNGAAAQRLGGNAYVQTPLSWHRITPDGGLHAEFDRIPVSPGCAAKGFVQLRALATRASLAQVVSAMGGAGDTARQARTPHGRWRVRTTVVEGHPWISAVKLIRVAPRRYAGVTAYVYFDDRCPVAAGSDATLVDAVERLVRTARLELHRASR